MPFFAFGRSRKRTTQLPASSTKRSKPRLPIRLQLENLEQRITPAVHDLTTAGTFATIQAAVNAANPGDVLLADAGTYTENVTINKALTLEGAKHGQNADARFAAFVGGKADPTKEAILTTPTNNPLGVNPGANDLIRVTASGVTIDGLVIDGNNPALGASLVTGAGGVAIHARRGVTNVDATGAFVPVNNLLVENNIIQNLSQRGVSLDNNFSVASTGNVITGNVIRDFGSDPTNGGYGVILFHDAYSDVTNNTIIDDFGGQTGIQQQDFTGTGTMTWSGNRVTVGQDGIGIETNFFTAPAGVVNILNNTVNAAAGVTGASDLTFGVYVLDVTSGATVQVINNAIGSSGGQLARGVNLWDLPTANTVTIAGGTIANSVTGIDLDSVDPDFGAGMATTVNINSVAVTGGTTGILVRAATVNQLSPPPNTVDPTASVAANLTGDSIVGATTGVLLQGFTPAITAAATLFRNFITGAVTGVQVNANGVLGAIAQPTTQNLIVLNGTGIALAAGAGPVQPIIDNNLSSTNLAINNLTGTMVDASLNYFGTNTAAGVAAKVSANVDYSPFFDSGTNTQAALTPGFNGDFTVLDVAAASPQAQVGLGQIQEGVNDAATGGTVNVTAGTYAENVTINKNLTLAGAPGDPQTSIIQAAGETGVAISAPATTVTVKGLKITGAANGVTATGQTTLNLADLTLTGNTTSGGSVSNIGTLNYTPDSTTGASVTITPTTFQRGTDQAVTFSAVPTFIVNGSPGSDTFDVTPNATTTFTVHGNAPTPLTAPPGGGDSLTVEQAGTTTPLLSATFDPTMGFSGSETFGNRMPVIFDGIERLPGTAATATGGFTVTGFERADTGSQTVATFTDPAAVPPSAYSATIFWGDGTSSQGVITQSGVVFTVSGSHMYLDEGTFAITVQINLNGGPAATTTSRATILEELLTDGTRGDSNQRFLNEVYRDLFNRKVEPLGLASWLPLLQAGQSRFQVAEQIDQDRTRKEFFSVEVQNSYQQFLHHAADPAGLNASANFLAAGNTVEQLDAILISSPEYFQAQGGGTNAGFAAALYRDALGRQIQPSESQTIVQFLAHGGTRAQVANIVLNSNEYRTDLVQSFYMHYLDRAADAAGLQGFVNGLGNGLTDETVIAIMIGSPEYSNKTAN